MTTASAIAAVTIAAVLGIFAYGFRHELRDWITRKRDTWMIRTYDPGTHHEYTHITPTCDGDHYESIDGDCQCNPTARDYESSAGWRSTFYVHRVMAHEPERRAR